MNERDLFMAVVQMEDTAERCAYLDRACAGETALRQRVEALLAAFEQARSFLQLPAMDPRATSEVSSPDSSSASDPVERPGTVIGPYKLLEQIGEGGFGIVFLAEQTHPVRRKVALKVLKPGMDTRQVVGRFEAERQALAIMDHPHIAKVFDGGATASGRPYFVMELVKGVPITEFCDQNHWTPRQRLELFLTVCQAVQHAHQKGIIHRDLKPSNVLVSRHDTTPVVKVIDFGVAKALGQELTDKTFFTGVAQMVGTPLYMSPEQAGMSDLDVDTRSDIYSLGVLLYELLTGTTPYTKERFQNAGYDEIRRIIREEEPPKPSTRLSESTDAMPLISAQRHTEPARLTQLVRGELDWIVMKALEKDRNRRYETANGFAMDLQRYLADEPVQACPPSMRYRLRKFVRRNKAPLAFTGLVLLVLLTLTGGVGWNMRDRAARQTAVEQEVMLALKEAEEWQEQGKWPEALSAAKRAEGLLAGSGSDELRERVHQLRKDLDMVLHLDDIRLLSSDKFDYERADQAYAQAFADYGIDVVRLPADEAAARIRGRPGVAIALVTSLDHWANKRRRKDEARSLALTAVAQVADPDLWRRRVREACKQNDVKALRALAVSPELLRQPPTTLVILARAIRMDIGLLRAAQRQYPGDFWINLELALALRSLAPPHRNESVSFIRAALAVRPRSTGALNLLGFYLAQQGKLDEAIDTYQRALELDPKFTWARLHLGMALQQQGKEDEAIDTYRRASELDPKSADPHYVLGYALKARKKIDEAIAEHRKAIELDPKSADALFKLGNFLRELGKLPEAVDAFREAIDRDPKSVYAHINLGNAFLDQKRIDQAIGEYRTAIDLNPKDALAHYNLGIALGAQEKLPEAIDAFHKAIDINSGYVDAYIYLGVALAKLHRLPEAIKAYQNAIRVNPRHSQAYVRLGNALRAQQKLPEAIDAFYKAIDINPKYAFARNNLGCALQDQKKLDEAKAEYREAIRLDPKYAQPHLNLGAVLRGQKKLDEAAAEYRKAIDLEPKFSPAHYNLGTVLSDQGKLDEAIAEYRKAIEFDPKNTWARSALGSALARKSWELANDADPKRRDPKRAVELATQAIKFVPQSVAALQNLGWVQYRAGNWKASIEALEKSCKLQEGGTGDCGQWIVMSLAHGKLANKKELSEQERDRHKTEAHRWYDLAVKQIDGHPGLNDGVGQAIRAFRAEAVELLGVKEEQK